MKKHKECELIHSTSNVRREREKREREIVEDGRGREREGEGKRGTKSKKMILEGERERWQRGRW